MAENAITCTVCGGTDFTKEAGYYYCNECQTQSQDVQEHVFETAAEESQPAVSKRTHSKRIRTPKKEEDQLTSWECYNYIILGLVNELIQIGAKESLKETVKILWFKYLTKLEVLTTKINTTPKLGACNFKLDAEIVFGIPAKRKKIRSRTPSPSTSDETSDSRSTSRQRSKSKRSLVLSEYDKFNTQLKTEEVSLHNQSLTSLDSGSLTSPKREKRLYYNKSATKEILNVMSKNHFKDHCKTPTTSKDCHNLSYRSLSSKYLKGPEVLTRKRIYAIIYLGLLINKEKIQLGDMLRFIREGYLSYDNVDHFFPEEYGNRNLNIKSWNVRNSLLTHNGMRVIAAKIAKLIKVGKYITRPNLIDLCQRYCKELNLPDEIWGFTLNLMSRVPSKMHFDKYSQEIPNYEGRVLSFILFTNKLMFGLDGCSEEYLSTLAETINTSNTSEMFVWRNWAHYIIYRRLVVTQHHFPTQHIYDDGNIQHCKEFITYITEQNLKYDKEVLHENRVSEVLKGLLQSLKDKLDDDEKDFVFTPSLTPFQDYVDILLESSTPSANNYLVDVLRSNFEKTSIGFVTNPYYYLDMLHINKRIGIKHRGANQNLLLVKIQNRKSERAAWRRHAKRKCLVAITRKKCAPETKSSNNQLKYKLDTKMLLKKFELQNMESYKKQMLQMAKKYHKSQSKNESKSVLFTPENIPSEFTLKDSSTEVPYIHYNSYDRFWLRSRDVSVTNNEEFQDFFIKFPASFRTVFNECARMSEQGLKEYFEEYCYVEIYLCYASRCTSKDQLGIDTELSRLIKIAIERW